MFNIISVVEKVLKIFARGTFPVYAHAKTRKYLMIFFSKGPFVKTKINMFYS